MSFKDYINEINSNLIFPSDEKIKEILKAADAAFWKVIMDNPDFKNFVDTADINPELSAKFNAAELGAVKEWLNNNKPEDVEKKIKERDKNPNRGFIGGVTAELGPDVGSGNVAKSY